LVRIFTVLEVTAGKDEPNLARPVAVLSVDDDAVVDRFREDACKGRHRELVVVWNASSIGEFDRLDPHLQEGRSIENVFATDDGPMR
jgi:hypothetical protein